MKFAIGAAFLSLIFAAGAAPGKAGAQPADPIDALLRQAQGEARGVATPVSPEDEDAAEAAGRPLVPQPDPTVGLPRGPIPYSSAAAPPSHLTEPVTLDEAGKTPDQPPSVRDLAYESRLRSSFASAQGFQGPLDGSFILSAGSEDLYALELVDRTRGPLEGAWRDLKRPGVSGFIDDIQRTAGGDLILRFGATSATLRGGATGQWSGQVDDNGRSRSAVLKRTVK